MTIRVLLVDDQELLRAGFRMVLDAHADVEVVGEAGDGAEAMRLIDQVDVDVVLMDVRMPGMDGIEATRLICTRPSGQPRVLILTTFDLDEYVYEGLRAGASGFLLKDVRPPALVDAIRVVASGDAVVDPVVTRRLLDRFIDAAPHAAAAEDPRLASLTPREHDVLIEMAKGSSNAEVAEQLYLSEATVKTYVGRILAKLALRDRVQAVVFAYEHGLVRAGER
ncbi:MAG: two component transcriptional regulator, luxr family protein [Acidimicrobiales bacterium]|nr:two component transcriptional regulator, luxr family protein [Acidimicrobiales bacterium]